MKILRIQNNKIHNIVENDAFINYVISDALLFVEIKNITEEQNNYCEQLTHF
jgi:hypothetical protein